MINSNKERVDELIQAAEDDIKRRPTSVTTDHDTWMWFAECALAGLDPDIRFERSVLMYKDVRIRWRR